MKKHKQAPTFLFVIGIVVLIGVAVGLYKFSTGLKGQEQAVETTAKVNKLNKAQSINYTLFTTKERKLAKTLPLTIIGDSITEGAKPLYKQIFKKCTVSSEVGRQVQAAPDIITEYANDGKLTGPVLIALGTNGPMSAEDLDGIMSQLGTTRKVYWVNVHVPEKSWETEVNNVLATNKAKYPNLKVIDWHSYCAENPEWYEEDNVHPNASGSKEMVTFIAKDILKDELAKS